MPDLPDGPKSGDTPASKPTSPLFGSLLPGETPIDDASGLKNKAIRSRGELNAAEAEGIGIAMADFLGGERARTASIFELEAARQLHEVMFGEVWY